MGIFTLLHTGCLFVMPFKHLGRVAKDSWRIRFWFCPEYYSDSISSVSQRATIKNLQIKLWSFMYLLGHLDLMCQWWWGGWVPYHTRDPLGADWIQVWLPACTSRTYPNSSRCTSKAFCRAFDDYLIASTAQGIRCSHLHTWSRCT